MVGWCLRALGDAANRTAASDEASDVLDAHLGAAQAVEGHTIHGDAQACYQAAKALQGTQPDRFGAEYDPGRYLIDANTGELVIRVSDLHAAARRVHGGALPRGFLEGRLTALGWRRVVIEGHEQPGRAGRRGPRARCVAMAGFPPVTTPGVAVVQGVGVAGAAWAAMCSAESRFTTRTGAPRDRYNLRQRVVLPVARTAAGLLEGREDAQPLPAGVSPHKLRHTFASILVALGNDPAYVMGQLGHTDPAFTLRVYSHMMRRDAGERDRLRALVGGADWAPAGTSAVQSPIQTPVEGGPGTVEPPC
jgi:hypothetical protein